MGRAEGDALAQQAFDGLSGRNVQHGLGLRRRGVLAFAAGQKDDEESEETEPHAARAPVLRKAKLRADSQVL